MNIEQKLNKEVSRLLAVFSSQTRERSARKTVTFDDFLSDRMLMISVIRHGVPYAMFDLIKDVTPFSESEWADLLDISTKSLHRYKKVARPFRPLQSEKIIEMAEVTKTGKEVFGDLERFKLWLDTPNFALGNQKPKELLKESYGKELVMGELVRIDHGILA